MNIPFTSELLIAIREAIAYNDPDRLYLTYWEPTQSGENTITLSNKAIEELKALMQFEFDPEFPENIRVEIFEACRRASLR